MAATCWPVSISLKWTHAVSTSPEWLSYEAIESVTTGHNRTGATGLGAAGTDAGSAISLQLEDAVGVGGDDLVEFFAFACFPEPSAVRKSSSAANPSVQFMACCLFALFRAPLL